MSTAGFIAGGNIVMSRFLKVSTTADNTVLQATDGSASHGDPIIGIAQKGSRNTPYSTLDDGYAAIAGEDILVFQENEYAPLEYGATVTSGQLLKADANGKGIPVTTDGDYYGAKAIQSGIAGQLVDVLILIGQQAT